MNRKNKSQILRNRIIKNSTDYWDYRLSWATTAFFIGSVANATLKCIFPIPESLWGLMSAIAGLSILIVFASCAKEMLRRSSIIFWRSVSIFLIVYFISALIITQRGDPLKLMITGTAFLTFAWWIPVGVFVCSVHNKSILYEVWVKASYIISILSLLNFFFYIPPEIDNGSTQYSMAFGFYIILPLLIQINEYLREKRLWLLLLILFEIYTILVYASRGILLSLFFFGTYKFAFESNSRFRKIVSIFVLIFLTIIMLASIQSLASVAVEILDFFGQESRTIEMLANGIAADSSGRDNIWKLCFKMIEQRPLLGWGLGGEYYEIGKLFGATIEETNSSCNPHNGVVQNFVCLGIIGGMIATFIVLFPMLHLKRYKDENVHNLILIFLSSAVIPICISAAGFFTNPSVAMYLYLFYFNSRR